MYDPMSNYALNKKDAEAIVYTDADGRLIRLTRADFSSDLEFVTWKSWSDENYHAEEIGDHVEANHTLSLEELDGCVASRNDPEAVTVAQFDKAARDKCFAEALLCVRLCLSDTQFRRLWRYHVDGWTQQQIAAAERVGQGRVCKSIESAESNAKNFFEKMYPKRG